MSIDDRKAQAPSPSPDKKEEKIKDLPQSKQSEKDEQVKGGRMKSNPRH